MHPTVKPALTLVALQVLGAPVAPQVLGAPAGTPAKISRTGYRVSPSLSQVSNQAAFTKQVSISPAQRALIARNGFAVLPTTSRQLHFIYEENDYKNVPSLVTPDTILHLYHIFFSFSLRKIETERLLPILKRVTAGMLAASVEDYNARGSVSVQDAALRNVVFFGVADRLLGGSAALPDESRALVARELALIGKHEGFEQGAIFPYKIDYSQFVPRGHYTRSEDLKRFFRAMMLFGLSPFSGRAVGETPVDEILAGDTPLLQGLLWTRALYSAKLDRDWERVYEPSAFFVGAADDLTPREFRAISERVYGSDPTIQEFGDASKMPALKAELQKARAAQVAPKFASQMGKPVPAGGVAVSGPLPSGPQLRFMGQRYVPDSEVLQQLSEPFERPFPSGLDVMATFGSRRAATLLDAHADIYNPGGWARYASERARMTAHFASLGRETWVSNLYYGWLYALNALNAPAPTGAPAFMRNEAWQDKSLWSALGSWAQLRHDTVLYVKQSAVEMGGGEDERPFVKGYVEPNVLFYDRMLSLVRTSREGLMKRQLLPQDLYEKYGDFERILSRLREMSRKELAGQALTREEYETIRFFGGELEGMMIRVMGEGKGSYWTDVPETDRDMATVADVHTAATQVLEAGVGRAHELLAVVPVEGKLVLARGATLSFYEFPQPSSNRLTDEAWQAQLKQNKTPAPPVWTRSFLAPGAARRVNEDVDG